MKGVVIQQVGVLPEELTVHLGSLATEQVRGATAASEASGQRLDVVELQHDGRAVTWVNSEQAPKDCRGRRPGVNAGGVDPVPRTG